MSKLNLRLFFVFLLLSFILNFSSFLLAELQIDVSDGLESVARQKAVDDFLSSQRNEFEYAKTEGYLAGHFDDDGNPDIAFVWTTMGPTYWRNTLTILSKGISGYTELSSFPLIGEAKLRTVDENLIIHVDQVVYAKGDPICCPSIKKQMKYQLRKDKIFEIE